MPRYCSALLVLCAIPQTLLADDAVTDLLSATFKVTNKTSTAACFIVARGEQERILVTAAHTFEKMTGDECRFVLRERRTDGSLVRKEVPLKIRAGEKPLWTRHPQFDVAALKLVGQPFDGLDAIDFDRLLPGTAVAAGKLRVGDEVWLGCYPAQLESSSVGFAVLRRGTVASLPLAPMKDHPTMLIDYSSFGGDSGGPVMLRATKRSDELPPIVGLVLGQHRETTKIVSPIEERTVHRSLGLGIIAHAEFIRQTIERIPEK